MSKTLVSYKRHRFPRELIAHAVWLSFRFPLSFRLVEEMLLERGIVVSYKTIRRWSLKFGAEYVRSLRRKRAKRGDLWHLDEIRVVIGGHIHWLWRAVDQDGYILDEILQRRRNTKAAKRKLRLSVRHLSHKELNNRAENSHLPLRKRERIMQRFRSPGGCQRFVSVFSVVRNLFVPPAANANALTRHIHRLQAFAQWKTVTILAA
ncbi:IS6 family transposase (plasmid) [Neokomagataea tanensis]|uniref:IS6 family transposase n=2 Tax=Neokomagataea TaxID=1223423 RepID=A0A4Y6VAZ5_9PROT|nr:IS6 family transposase [Neokomagataea tanensis]